jgi:lysophospholipase L1-like esterase
VSPSTQLVGGKPLEDSAAAPRAFRPVWGYLAVVLPAALLAADMGLAVARGWRTNSRLDRVVMGALAAWLLAATTCLVLPPARRFFSRFGAQLIALSVSLCLVWLVAEFALGPVLAVIGEPFHCRRPGLQFVYHPRASIMRDVGPETHVHFNAWGVRGDDPPPPDAASRILCVGGSSTACTYLDDAKTWPALLGRELDALQPNGGHWVGNIGLPSFRTAEHLQFIGQSSLVDRVDCLIVQAGVNDFMSCLAGPHPQPLWTSSRVRKLVRTVAARNSESDMEVEDTGGDVYLRRRAVRASAKLDDRAPDLEAGLREFADNVRKIIETCGRRNVRVVFTTQPVLWKPDLDAENRALLWFGLLPDGRFLSVDQLRAGMDRYNETLAAVCQEQGAELVDLSQLNGDPGMFYDDCHFTETGSRRVAQLVVQRFANRPIEIRQKTP